MIQRNKNNHKTIRYSDRFGEIVESYKGNSFNEKLENMVLFCHDEVPRVEKQLKRIKDDIEKEWRSLLEVQQRMRDMKQLRNTLDRLQEYGEIAAKKAEAMAEDFKKQ